MLVDGGKLRKKLCKEKYRRGSALSMGWKEFLGAIKDCRVDARIEAAIRFFDKEDKEMRQQDAGAVGVIYARYPCDLADLLRWVLGQDQDTWKDGDFGLEEETTRSDEGT